MWDNLNYNELLNDYEDNEYVYIVETCMDIYVTTFEPELYYCETCGNTDSLIAEGYVYELRDTKYVEKQIPHNKNKLIAYRNNKIKNLKVKNYKKQYY